MPRKLLTEEQKKENLKTTICDYEAMYDIVMNTHYCDNKECKKKLVFRGSKPAHNSKCLDHCHKCGCVRGVICNVCNLQNALKCELCDNTF